MSFIFRSGKYKGKSKDWVEENDLGYLEWIEKNRPEMLKDFTKKKVDDTIDLNYKFKPLSPNYNFDKKK